MTLSTPSILLVDDLDANLVALEAQLSELDCEIIRVNNGNDALRLLLKQEFAVMLLDVQMPDMDGYEVARFARENPRTRDVPIIFVTAMDETDSNLLRSYGAGAVDVLFKPINPHVLRSKVRVFLALYLSRLRLAGEVAAHQKTAGDLELANQELTRISQLKTDFLSMMSHELRTPLNAINGFSELLLDQQWGALNERQLRFMNNVHEGGKHLLTLISDLLDLSKIEAGRLEVEARPCSPRVLVEEAVITFQQLADKKSVALVLEPSTQLAIPDISADPVRTKQILFNLISNAIKFTPSGGRITVGFFVPPEQERLRFVVADSGPGIAPLELEQLFKRYSQLDNAKSAPQGSTGLGLALSRQLAELMGGSAGVESTVGVGSRFYFDLPLVPASSS